MSTKTKRCRKFMLAYVLSLGQTTNAICVDKRESDAQQLVSPQIVSTTCATDDTQKNSPSLFMTEFGCDTHPPTSSCVSQTKNVFVNESNGTASVTFGNGIIYGLRTTDYKAMRWRAGEIRFGRNVSFFGVAAREYVPATEVPRIDVVYYNEGHPDNNHRDGYAIQFVYRKKMLPGFGLEFAVGPYFSMNRTTMNDIEYDDRRLGALVSMATIVHLDALSRGIHLRFAYNQVYQPNVHSSASLMMGIGKELGLNAISTSTDRLPVWFAVSSGFSQTNHANIAARFNYAVEAKGYFDQWATSIMTNVEGDDGVRVNRRGLAIQEWYVQPLSKRWSISAGVGPYLATNKRESDEATLNGLITIQIERNLSKTWKVFTSFGRVVTFKDKTDADLIKMGVMKRFNL